MNELKLPKNIETITLKEQKNYRFNEINKVKDYLECEIKERELLIKTLSRYITDFDYADKYFLTVFSSVSNFSHIKTKKHVGLIS